MFAANQGQNRSRGWPLRSFSAMTLMPFVFDLERPQLRGARSVSHGSAPLLGSLIGP